jgi:hypothetical protein
MTNELMRRRRSPVMVSMGLALACIALPAFAQDPKLPPGRDPGGVAVAVLGAGADYTSPQISARLARDGEGEIIGWDFADNDNRPFTRSGSTAAPLLSRLAPRARLVIVRGDPKDRGGLARMIGFVARTPARIVLIEVNDTGGEVLPDLVGRLPDRLFVLAAGDREPGSGHDWRSHDNLLIVAGPTRDAPGSNPSVDLDVPAFTEDAGGEAETSAAAVRIAALAARLQAEDPNLTGAGLKRRIVEFAKNTAAGRPRSRHGRIEDPESLPVGTR